LKKLERKLPFDAELMQAKHRKFEETVVLVHNFGGSRRTVLRHARLLNDLGFDCVRFDLIFHQAKPQQKLPITADLRFGVRHVWANQIESLLNAISGRKILYTFSMPSGAAFEAVAKRQARDVAGIIADGGPFLQLHKCVWNLYQHEYNVKSRVLRAGFTAASLVLWGLSYTKQMKEALEEIPRNFPVLSIRGWNDPLVPVTAIDEFFALQSHLDLETFPIPEGTHLDGLRNFSNDYVPRVEKFLVRISTPATQVAALDNG
jgi:pimeloyl-ACP methyl ester carboxylesterase